MGEQKEKNQRDTICISIPSLILLVLYNSHTSMESAQPWISQPSNVNHQTEKHAPGRPHLPEHLDCLLLGLLCMLHQAGHRLFVFAIHFCFAGVTTCVFYRKTIVTSA